MQEVRHEDGGVWIRLSAANSPRCVAPEMSFHPQQILLIEIADET